MLNTQTSAVIERNKQGVLKLKVEVQITPDFASERDALRKVDWLSFEKDRFVLRDEYILKVPPASVLKEKSK